MALNTVIFGDFSEAEVQTLLTTDTSDLEFAWQRNQHVGCPSGDAKCGIQHFPSAMLDIPEPLERRVYSPGALSPNIPPNPPTSPVEGEDGDPRMLSKLNVNAPAFVPASLSVIDKTNMATGMQRSSGDHTSPFNPLKESDGDLTGRIAANDRHVRTPDGHRGEEAMSSPSGTRVQTIGQVTTNVPTSVSHPGNTGVSAPRTSSSSSSTPLSSPPPPLSLPQNKDAPTLSPPPPIQPAQAQSIYPVISTQAESLTSLNLATVTPRTTRNRSLSPHSLSSEATPTSLSRTSHSPTPTPTVAEVTTSSTANFNKSSGALNPAPKSWASIVSGKSFGAPIATTNAPRPTQVSAGGQKGEGESSAVASSNSAPVDGSKVEGCEQQVAVDPMQITSQLQSLGEQLKGVGISHVSVSVQPRGLINQGNWCYIHAPLQALLSCPGMYNLLKSVSPFPTLSHTPTATPLTDSMVQFVHEFEPYPKSAPIPDASHSKTRKKRPSNSHKLDFFHGEPFRPDYIYDMLAKIRSTLSYKGRQEDAEEFLGCVLDGLHEEMVSAQKVVSESREVQDVSRASDGGHMEVDGEKEREECEEEKEEEEEEEEEEWEQVGPKNKSTITRQTSFSESPITELFGGELRSAVRRQGAKDSATVEPFFSLQLDIQSEEIWTVKDALDALAVKETVQMNTGTHREVEAQKRITLARLPPILILHLKRFIFNKTGGSQKLQKHITYSTEMEIGKELLAPAIKNKLSLSQRSYRLWAVVYHHGKYATGGHYTCDVCHPVCGGWVRIDDSVLKPVSEEMVLRQSQTSNKVAYLLFYRRADSIRT